MHRIKKMLGAKSVIREMFTYGMNGQREWKENAFGYSLGNPSVPVPEKFTKKMIELLETKVEVTLDGPARASVSTVCVRR